MKKSIGMDAKDWDFSGVPESLLSACCGYEYARHSSWIKSQDEIWRSGGDQVWDECGFTGFFRNLSVDGRCLDIWLPTDFPKRTFWEAFTGRKRPLSLLSGERGAVCDIGNIEQKWSAKFPELPNKVRASYASYSEVKLLLDMSRSDAQIKQDFAAWLAGQKKDHSKAGKSGKSPARRLERRLRDLAAFRLLSVMKVAEAREITKEETGQCLLSDHTDWLKARARAQKLLKQVFRATDEDLAAKPKWLTVKPLPKWLTGNPFLRGAE